MQILVMVSTGSNIALWKAMIGFSPVLVTPRTQRATSPTARFFHVPNLMMRSTLSVFMVTGLGVPIRKDGSTAVYV